MGCGFDRAHRGVDERSELERFTGAEAQIECASDAALKGRSSTVRDRLGSATRMLCRGKPARQVPMQSHASLRSAGADEASAPTQDWSAAEWVVGSTEHTAGMMHGPRSNGPRVLKRW